MLRYETLKKKKRKEYTFCRNTSYITICCC